MTQGDLQKSDKLSGQKNYWFVLSKMLLLSFDQSIYSKYLCKFCLREQTLPIEFYLQEANWKISNSPTPNIIYFDLKYENIK